MSKPSITTRCPAAAHSLPDERIVEFSSAAGGGLLALRVMDGVLYLDIYRADPSVRVRCDAALVQTEHPIGAGKSAPRNARDA